MSTAHNSVDSAIADLDRLLVNVKKVKAAQVTGKQILAVIKATSLAWFNNYRPAVASVLSEERVRSTDEGYRSLLGAVDRATSRARYCEIIKGLRQRLSELRVSAVSMGVVVTKQPTTDTPPSFATLIPDPAMQAILARRWNECVKCVGTGAALAGIVMMGGLLESLLLARVNKETDKSKIISAAGAPKDKITGKTQPLQEWTLRHYIDVAHELKWITESTKDIGVILRDYRNYIHPFKELSHGVELRDSDAVMFWEVSKAITRQLL